MVFSKLFYGIEVWAYDLLTYESKRQLDSFYFKCCRVILGDWMQSLSRDVIYESLKRATPQEYSNYATARIVIKAFLNNIDNIKDICEISSYTKQRKIDQLFFYDNSKIRVGKNSINNRIGIVFNKINFGWLNKDFNQIRPLLKKTFFAYFN